MNHDLSRGHHWGSRILTREITLSLGRIIDRRIITDEILNYHVDTQIRLLLQRESDGMN